MASRFVPAGTDPVPAPSGDDWDKARQKVEERRNVKPLESGKQEDGRSLFEVLQANKAAKQEAFEEATKVRNQFRSLDDSEIEFLETIRENERAKEHSVQRETAEQLELFRKQRAIAEQDTTESDDPAKASQEPSVATWTTLKKRRRDNDERNPIAPKLRKSSSDGPYKDNSVGKRIKNNEVSTPQATQPKEDVPSTTRPEERSDSKNAKPNGLGLVAYDSDEE